MTILYGSGISNSTRHSGENLPLLVMGGGAGKLKGGRHLTYTDKPSMANLLMTLMDKMDVPVERIGGSTGKLQTRYVGAIDGCDGCNSVQECGARSLRQCCCWSRLCTRRRRPRATDPRRCIGRRIVTISRRSISSSAPARM